MRLRLAVCLAAFFTFALAPPARAAGPADLLTDLRAWFRWLWSEEGSDLDPNGRTVPRPAGPGWIWAEEGSSLDPDGRTVPRSTGLWCIWAEEGSSLDPSGRSAPPPNQEGSDLDPDGARRQVGSSLDPNG